MGNKPAVYVDADSYYALLRALKGLPKEANDELRNMSKQIANDIVKPSVERAIRSHAGPYADKLAKDVRVSRDRVPKVAIGSRRKRFSGGASGIQIRYGTIVGPYLTGARGQRSNKIQEWARDVTPGWTDVAARDYIPPAFDAWDKAVESIVTKWNKG
jgi:hypothetical protein